jgi:hypothetical protein
VKFVRPSGHLGDALVLSAVLRARHVRCGDLFRIVRCSPFTPIFVGHPAVALIASPGPHDVVAETDHWAWRSPEAGSPRAFGKLSAALFGDDMREEAPWCPLTERDGERLRSMPERIAPVVLANDSSAARRPGGAVAWSELARRIRDRWRVPVVQVGMGRRPAIDRTTNVSGNLTARELVTLVSLSQAVIASDPLVIAAASAGSVPAIALIGSESPQAIGFPGQLSVQQLGVGPPTDLGTLFDARLGPALDPSRPLHA